MGGLVARVALLFLDKFQNNLYSYVSFGTPHTGLGELQSKLIATGIWIIKKLNKKSLSLK